MTTVYFTICARNYLGYALTLRASLLEAAPGADFRIFLADENLDAEDAAFLEQRAPGAASSIVPLSAAPLPDRRDMAFRYDVMEFATAIKPFCFQRLFETEGAGAAIYLDPDILVLRPLDEIAAHLGAGADAVLTPHFRTPPPADGKKPTEREILQSGVFNLGFLALANADEPKAFLSWWGEQCAKRCFSDPARGLFVDQKFCERLPEFVARAEILKHPGYNVAYWNLHERTVERAHDGYVAGGAPLVLFHFSGVKPGDASLFSKHQTRFDLSSIGAASDLLHDYLARLDRMGQGRFSKLPYACNQFADGGKIPRAARRLYAARVDAGEKAAAFDADIDYLNAPDTQFGAGPVPITRLMAEIWRERADLQSAFPLETARGRERFAYWLIAHGAAEAGLDKRFMAPILSTGRGKALSFMRQIYRRLPGAVKSFLNKRPPN